MDLFLETVAQNFICKGWCIIIVGLPECNVFLLTLVCVCGEVEGPRGLWELGVRKELQERSRVLDMAGAKSIWE